MWQLAWFYIILRKNQNKAFLCSQSLSHEYSNYIVPNQSILKNIFFSLQYTKYNAYIMAF